MSAQPAQRQGPECESAVTSGQVLLEEVPKRREHHFRGLAFRAIATAGPTHYARG